MTAFVIMPFAPELSAIYASVIVPVCRRLGIEPLRADRILEPGSIPDQITSAIRNSSFVIGEISNQNDNVFYELGYAHAVGKKSILLSDRSRQLPFDVRVSRTIIYERVGDNWHADLRESLISTVGHLFDLSSRLLILNLHSGQELKGHMHTITGNVKNGRFPQHLWSFAKRADLDTWWPQDDGEVCVNRDGSWTAQVWLGREDRKVDTNRFYSIKFGFLDPSDNRDLTELVIKSKYSKRFVGIREIPKSFEELALLNVKRIE